MMNNTPTSTPVSNSIIKWIMGGYDQNKFFEDSKREFIKKYNPKFYQKLYVNIRNNK